MASLGRKTKLSQFQQVGRLTLLNKYLLPINPPKNRLKKNLSFWYCICKCGNTKFIRERNLLIQHTLSCGCLQKEKINIAIMASLKVRIKYSKETRKSLIFKKWRSIWHRTQANAQKTSSVYKNRGIGVCDEWRDFYVFKKFAEENGFKPGLTIDRIDNYRGYSPDNIRFVTIRENLKNRRPFCEWSPRKLRKFE